MRKIICHENVFMRFAGLYIMGLVLFMGAWYLGYNIIPEGAMKGSSLAAKAAGEEVSANILSEFSRIFITNLVMTSLLILFNLAIRINRVPLGYIIPLVWFVLYGLILGSNSFSIPLAERIGPSVAVFRRSGLYEMAAYTMIAASTFGISRFEIKKLFLTNPEKITIPVKLGLTEYLAILAALLMLLLSNLRETLMLINQV